MRYVFLDVDGVLNNQYTKNDKDKGYVYRLAALDFYNISILKEFLDKLYEKYGKDDIKLILSSSWRDNGMTYNPLSLRGILDTYLAKWDISIDEELPELPFEYNRGAEICSYLKSKQSKLEGYLVLDDHFFDDYKKYKITRHWVQTVWESTAGIGGLQKKHIKYALRMMDNKIKDDEWKTINDFSI